MHADRVCCSTLTRISNWYVRRTIVQQQQLPIINIYRYRRRLLCRIHIHASSTQHVGYFAYWPHRPEVCIKRIWARSSSSVQLLWCHACVTKSTSFGLYNSKKHPNSYLIGIPRWTHMQSRPSMPHDTIIWNICCVHFYMAKRRELLQTMTSHSIWERLGFSHSH